MLTLSQTKISGVITPSGGQKKPKFVLIDRESILGKENYSDSLLPNILYHTPYSQMADTREKTGA